MEKREGRRSREKSRRGERDIRYITHGWQNRQEIDRTGRQRGGLCFRCGVGAYGVVTDGVITCLRRKRTLKDRAAKFLRGGVEEHRRFARNATLPDRLGLLDIVRGAVQDVRGQRNEGVGGGELNGRVGGKRALPTHWPVSQVSLGEIRARTRVTRLPRAAG